LVPKSILNMELDLQPGDVVKVLESAALGWVRARVIRVKSGGRVVVQSDQGREFTARGNQVRLIEPAGLTSPSRGRRSAPAAPRPLWGAVFCCPQSTPPPVLPPTAVNRGRPR
jgi:hypothetical protein